MSTDLERAGAECVQEMSAALLHAAGQVMKRHGNDPCGGAIVAAGFAMALDAIGRDIDRKVPLTVCEMLHPLTSTMGAKS
jgi:hypothetical protein